MLDQEFACWGDPCEDLGWVTGDLLAMTRELLLSKRLPALPEELRYGAFMIANAMAISLRVFDISEQAEHAEYNGLRHLFGDSGRRTGPAVVDAGAGIGRQSPVTAGDLARRIRRGSEGEELLSHLTEIARLRLAIGNPRRPAESDSQPERRDAA